MNFTHLRAWAEIDLDAIEQNYRAIRSILPERSKLLAVVKADAYGHGAVPIVRFLQGKADFFAVATIDEAIELRHAGIHMPLLILGYTLPACFPLLLKYDIRPTIFTLTDAQALSRCASEMGKTANIHIALDTGMSRIGFSCTDESLSLIHQIATLPNLCLEGIFSHFANADATDESYTTIQKTRFTEFTERLADCKIHIPF